MVIPRSAVFFLAVCAAVSGAAGGQDASLFWERASLYRDEWGVPHVYGDDLRALAFVFGYAQADDHIEPMLFAYRVANGRAAEVFGEPYAASDEFALKLGHGTQARAAFQNAAPVTVDLCEGFALGVNAWLVDHPEKTPPWSDGVRPEDILALLHCYLMSMAPFDLPNTWRRDPAAVSGNAWAVGPARSETGRAMLAINPHTAYDGPFQWYEAHLVCQDMNVSGATLFGLPVILQGHNPVLGWALTPNRPDFADMYMESPASVERDNPKKVNERVELLGDKMLELLLLSHSRPYYVNTPQGVEERAVPCVNTPRGPVVGTLRGRLCSWRIGGYQDFGTLAQLIEMARAPDLAAFQSAVAMHQLPFFHITYADAAGNIAYLYNAKTGNKPVYLREPPAAPPKEENPANPPPLIDWTAPVPAGNPMYEWAEIIPVSALPAILNPETGYVQACGNPPWAATDPSPIVAAAFPQWFAQDRDSYRAQRVRRLLNMGKRSFRDCQSMLYDIVVPFATDAVPRLLQAAADRPGFVNAAHPDLALGLDILRGWNFLADTGSTGMTFFQAWWMSLRARQPILTGMSLPQTDLTLYAALSENAPPMQEDALAAAADAARMMRNEFQSLTVPWGDVHVLRRGPRESAVPGAVAGEPVFAASDYVFDGKKWPVTYGYGFAMVVLFGDVPEAVSVVPFGTSENMTSPHFSDQMDLLVQKRFKVSRFLFEDVQRNASSARGKLLYLRPKGIEALLTLRAEQPIEARVTVKSTGEGSCPAELVPFTLYMNLEYAPRPVPVETEFEIYVPPALCAREDVSRLELYTCGSDLLWTPVERQEVEPETQTIVALDRNGPRAYVVLGPEKCRLSQPEPRDEPVFVPETGVPTPPQNLQGSGAASMPLAPQLPAGKKFFFEKGQEAVPSQHESPDIEMPEQDDPLELSTPARSKPHYDVGYFEPAPITKERAKQLKEIEKRNRRILRKAGILPPEEPKKRKKEQKVDMPADQAPQPAVKEAPPTEQPDAQKMRFNSFGKKKKS